jgi:hypothetical protein
MVVYIRSDTFVKIAVNPYMGILIHNYQDLPLIVPLFIPVIWKKG